MRFVALVITLLGVLGVASAGAQPEPVPEPPEPETEPEPEPETEPETEPEPEPETEMEPETEPETEPIAEDEDLSELEEALAADADELEAAEPEESPSSGPAQVIQADLAFIADFALAYFSEDENLQTGAHDPTETGFNLQQLELALGAAVDPYFRLDGNLVFSQFGVEIEEIYATTLALPHKLQVRAGQFLTRIGRINSTHPHSWRFVDQPLALGRIFGGEGNRGLGVELSWLSPLPWYVELVASVTDPAGEASARSFLGAQDLGLESPFDFQSSLAIKQFFPAGPNWSIAWGLSAATGPNPTGHDNRTNVFATDLYIKYRPIDRQSHTVVSLTAEYFYRRRQIPADVLADHSMYATLLWRFARRWTVAGRYELGTPASSEGADTLDPEWTDERQRVSAALTFFPTEFSRLRAQTALDYPGWQDEPIASAILAAEFLIGAHGAHEF